MKEKNNKKESVVVELNSNDNNFDTTKELNRLIIASVFINKLRELHREKWCLRKTEKLNELMLKNA